MWGGIRIGHAAVQVLEAAMDAGAEDMQVAEADEDVAGGYKVRTSP